MFVITVIPFDSHSDMFLSRSSMFVAPKYMTGVKLFVDANSWTVFIGDGIDFPVANQLSESATQNPLSMWLMIANFSVWIMLSISVYSMLFTSRCSLTMSLFGLVWLLAGVSSKFISENVGVSVNKGTLPNTGIESPDGVSMSKSSGRGNVSVSKSSIGGISAIAAFGVGMFCIIGCMVADTGTGVCSIS